MKKTKRLVTRGEALVWLGLAALCAACSGSGKASTGTGAAGGTGGTGTGGATGGTGASTTTTTATDTGGTGTGGASTGGTGTGGCAAPAVNVYDNADKTGLPACDHPIAPDKKEDGTFAITVFGPFAMGFQLEAFSFAASESPNNNTGITDPWTAAVIVVPAGSDPLMVNPSDNAKPYPLTLIEKLPASSGTANRYSIKLDAPLAVGACDKVVVALRNTEGPPLSALEMCGDGSAHPETNQWWNLNGTMSEMQSYGANFDRDWWVTLLPLPRK